jgi:hypothetical protein
MLPINSLKYFLVLTHFIFSINSSFAIDLDKEIFYSNPSVLDEFIPLDVIVGYGMDVKNMYIHEGEHITSRQYRSLKKSRQGYYVLYEKLEGTALRLIKISDDSFPVIDFKNKEILYFSSDLKFVEPDYRNFIVVKNSNEMLCWTGAWRTRETNAMIDYNPCESSLTKKSNINIGDAAFIAVFSFGLSVATGTGNRNVSVDKEKVISLIKETSTMDALMNWALQKASANKLATYRGAFRSAQTSAQIDKAVQQYSSEDPENLIPLALVKREQFKREEAQRNIDQQHRKVFETQNRDREMAALSSTIKKVGARVCRFVSGSTRAQLGSTFGHAIYEELGNGRTFALEGYVDAISENNLKITIVSITSKRLFQQQGIDSFSELPPIYTKGLFVWQEFEFWRPCQN